MKLQYLGRHEVTGDSLWSVLEAINIEVRPSACVPAGYVSNLGSIPRWARWFVSPSEGGFADLFLIHDWLCNEYQVERDKEINSGVSRWLSDAILYDLMVRRNLPAVKRYAVWLAVRAAARYKGLK